MMSIVGALPSVIGRKSNNSGDLCESVGRRLCVIVLTKNEEIHIRRALRSISQIADEMLVVDSFSTDSTVILAAEEGATVIQHEFASHSRQFNWALEQVGDRYDWIMRLDADETIDGKLAREIRDSIENAAPDIVAFNLVRRHYFMGRWIRFGARYPLILTRIWRSGHGKAEERLMDEHIMTWGGGVRTLQGDFRDENLKDIHYFIEKHNDYSNREAVQALRSGIIPHSTTKSFGIPLQARLKRFIRRGSARLPVGLSPLLYFVYRFVFRLGFLDGREGLIYHVLQGFWYRFLVDAKVVEFGRAMKNLSPEAATRELSRLSGLDIHLIDSSGYPKAGR